ncbi:hypothetical protein [Clostridium chauvoei]|uniref:Glucose/Sorbosone dehydrogenase domain-containing protein n=2 Tax=Clostridium chauvoei TaxID=46867 RepID=A0ABD4RFP1_9CLOT|nr:hypothetical protein [Clostridium chauvoei]ATD55648.1 hypothetical protein BTM20_10530 [Clostridium chauvoei]ATD56674.1 hypothetical protein BTM21_02490 [Clostridium chauvoei]MBX7280114.1 hypothetical protein [Clostridium chauvoei]MBX7282598.1 hypothetical protein [Clostridium chauvoei]MBX7285005.1 hypothetical protein [Clostridium chauvoei]
MKRFIEFLAISIIIVTCAFGIFKLTNKYDLDVIYQNIDWSIRLKGCNGAKSFDFDKDGNLYIAFKDTIRILNKDGKDEVIINESSFDILDILWHDDKLFIATDNRVVEYDPKTHESQDLVTDIPNRGENKNIQLLYKDDILYLTVGSNTNSGIVDEKGKAEDIATIPWILTGSNCGENKTGPFSPYSVSVEKGEKVKENKIGNASIMAYDLKNKETTIFSHGIRNVKGIDDDSEGNIKGIVGGMEDRGLRPIKDDKDYIYEFKKGAWYGWPDYSGGDPIISPRFTEGEKIDFLIENHPIKTPTAPLYQHKDISSLNGFAIDKEGKFFLKDTMIFADNKQSVLYALTTDGILKKLVDLSENSYVEKVKFYEDGFFILDSNLGCLYRLETLNSGTLFNLPKVVWIFFIGFLIVLLICIIFKFNKKNLVNKR